MSIELTISHEQRLVIAIVGEVGPEDFALYFAQIDAARAMPYRKIIDLSSSPLVLRPADIKALSQRALEYAAGGSMGAMAVVVNTDMADYVTETYDKYTKADRPFRTFRSFAAAMEWLDQEDKRTDPDRSEGT